MKTILLFLFCALFVTVPYAWANTEDEPYTIYHFTDQDGLPQNSIKGIAPDKNGFLWLATENGLARFDGSRFMTFNSGNLPIRNSRIFYLCPNAQRNSLIARTIKDEVLSVHNGTVSVSTRQQVDFNYLNYDDATDIYPITGLPNYYMHVAPVKHFLVPMESSAFFRVTKDTIRFSDNGRESMVTIIPGLDASRLFTSGKQLCYMGNNGQFYLVNSAGLHVLHLEGDLLQQKGWSVPGQERSLYWNFAAGQLFVVVNDICYRLQLEGDVAIKSSLVLQHFDFRHSNIHTIYHDAANRRLFLGSTTKGLYIYNHKQFRAFKTGGDEVFYAQAPFKKGVIVPQGVAFDAGGRRGSLPLLAKVGVTDDKYSMTVDHLGNYWYKRRTTIYSFNNDFSAKRFELELPDGITQLYADKEDRLWIGGMKGLYYLRTTDGHPHPELYTDKVKDISYMLQDDKQYVLWLGTGSGLYRMDIASRKVDTIHYFDNKYIRSLLITAPGELWITTYSNGIFLYKNNKLVQLPPDQQKYMITAHCIVKDDQGYLWITTNKGLFQCSYQDALDFAKGAQPDLYYLYYGKEQGFFTNEFNGGCEPCALKLENGDISFPSLDGLVYFDPADIRPELPDKQIFVDQVELDARPVGIDSIKMLPHNFHHLRFYVSTPYFGDPKNLHLFYSMTKEGEDEPALWLQVSDNRMIECSALPSGKYKLHIRKTNGFGKANMSEMIFEINVEKAFHETLWFRVLTGILFFVLAFTISWLRVRRVQRKNRILELRVQERTSELRETLDTLQVSEQQLRRQAFIHQRLITAISHDLRTPLKYIMHVLSNGYQRQDDDIDKTERTIIYESMYGMYHLVENLIQYMKSQFIDDDSFLEMTDLQLLLEEKADIFRAVSQSKDVTIINNTAPGTFALVNRQLLAIVIHNLLDNAVKYTRRGNIQLMASCEAEKIHIRFTDTGSGMPPLIAAWIGQYGQVDSVLAAKPASYNGIGLLMVMELLQLINGNIELSPNGNEGTMVSISLDMIS